MEFPNRSLVRTSFLSSVTFRSFVTVKGISLGLTICSLLGFLLSGFFNLLVFIIYIAIIIMIFTYANRNIRNLDEAVEPTEEASRGRPGSASDKIWLFRRFKVIIVSYLCLVMVILLVELIFLSNHPWVTQLFQQTLEIVLSVGI